MTGDALRTRFLERCSLAGIEPSPVVTAGVGVYFDLLRAWNRRINLTALNLDQPGDDVLDRLLVEPVVASLLVGSDCVRVMDVGSGGGSPALPFRLALPGASMTLVESRHKKAVFLREAVRGLGLVETRVEARRLDEHVSLLGQSELADVVTIRAVRVDASLLALVHRALKGGGRLLLFGADASEAEGGNRSGFTVETIKVLTQSHGSRVAVLRREA